MPSSFSRFLSEEELADVARLYEESLAALDDDELDPEQDVASHEPPAHEQAPAAENGEAAPPDGDAR